MRARTGTPRRPPVPGRSVGKGAPEVPGAAVAVRGVVHTMRLSMNAFGLRLGAPALVGAALAAGAWKFAATAARVPMPERLRAIAAATDPQTNMFQNADRAKALEARWTKEGEAAGPGVLMGLGKELLNAGRTA